jgi:streptogrisin C
MVEAMRRDLQLSDEQVERQLRVEATAASVEKSARAELGSTYGGAWLAPGGDRLTVAVGRVRAVGAEPTVVGRSEEQLTALMKALDRRAAAAGSGIHSWHVDVASNGIVVTADPGAVATATEFVRAAGVPAEAVRIVTSTRVPRQMADFRGGDPYGTLNENRNGLALCSVGFAVVGGFVTAGHCGPVGRDTIGWNNAPLGVVRGSTNGGQDHGWVQVNGDWAPQPWVNNYAGGSVAVAGSQEAAVGSSVCRSGRATGWRCGVITARNVSAVMGGIPVNGMIKTSACSGGGDSGGAVISGNQAQGVLSGGTGDCSNGAETFVQPVNEILRAYGLTLLTTGGGGSGSRLIGLNNKCIDVPADRVNEGVQLNIWDCHSSDNQSWIFGNDGTIRAFGLCMDVAWGSHENGAAIQLANCSGNPAQQFVLSGAGDLVNPQANKCVDVAGANPNNGTPLVLWDCTGQPQQKWRRG